MLDIKYLILLLVISLIFIIYTNYQCVKIGSKIETLQIELDQNIEGRMLEGFANLPEITFTDDTSFFASEDYLPKMNQVNLKARKLDNHSHALSKYRNSFQKIPDAQKKDTQKFIFQLMEKTSLKCPNMNKYLQYWMPKIKIAKQQPWLEAGMPHTHNTTIVLNPGWFDSPRQHTFIHELTHVHQRQKPQDFEELYRKWGFFYYQKGIFTIKGLEDKFLLSRHNPDGMDLNWVWKTPKGELFWISAEYIKADHLTLLDVEYLGYSLEKDPEGNCYYLNKTPISLSKHQEFRNYFQIHNNHYHPNEISANYSEKYLEDKLKGGDKQLNCKGYQIYYQHMEQLCQKLNS